jgi:ATP-dependent DNA helicase RecG
LDNNQINPILAVNVQSVQQVGKVRAQKLSKLGIRTIGDLVTYYPRDYEDRNKEKRVDELEDGDECAVTLQVFTDVTLSRPRRTLRIYKASAGDESGAVTLTWFNQDYIRDKIHKGSTYVFFGKVKKRGSYIEMANPIYEEAEATRKKTTGIQPVYPLTEGITQTYLRMIQSNALGMVIGKLSDILPEELRKQHALAEINFALEKVHFPQNLDETGKARKRLVFEELLMLQLGLLQLKNSQVKVSGIQFEKKPEIRQVADTRSEWPGWR